MANNEEMEIYTNAVYLADTGGTGFWRRIAPITTLNCLTQQLRMLNTYSMAPVSDPNWYRGMRSVTVQRWLTDQQRDFMQRFLRPLANQMGFWLVYEIDDATFGDDIPKYNKGQAAFAPTQTQENIRIMMNLCDIVTVTTTYLKEYVNRRYGVPLERIVAVPNLLPHWWIGDRYEPDKKLKQFSDFKAKPRIGMISSLSHFNIDALKDDKGNELIDDFHTILDTIRSTVDDFQWVILGYAHPSVKDLIEKRKIEYYPCAPILQYPSALEAMKLQAVVVPLLDNEFNKCKSPIKFLEGCALGFPVFCPDMLPYSRVVPQGQLYKDESDLQEKLKKMKFSSAGAYRKMIDENWRYINTPHEEGNCKLNNYWMEGNLGIWLDLFKLPNHIEDAKKKEKQEKPIGEGV